MADEDVNIRVRTEGTSEAASEVRSLGGATRDLSNDFDKLGQFGREAKNVFEQAFRSTDTEVETARAKVQEFISTMEQLSAEMNKIGAGAGNRAFEELSQVIEISKANMRDFETQVAALRNLPEPLANLHTGFAQIDAIIGQATAAVDRFDLKEQSGARVWLRDVDLVVQQTKRLELALIDQFGAVENGTTAAIQAYERLRGEQQRINQTANTLVNAYRDNRFAVNQFGNEVQALGMGVGQLSNLVGGNTAVVGGWITQLGLAGAGFEHMRDAVNALQLNTIQLDTAGAAAVLQWGAVAAAFAAATAAGFKLSQMEEGNREVTEDFIKSAQKYGLNLKEEVSDRIVGLQRALQDLILSYVELDPLQTKTAVAFGKGAEAADSYWIAQKAGITTQDQLNIILEKGTNVIEIYREAMQRGKAGQDLWADAVKKAHGNAEVFLALVSQIPAKLEELRQAHLRAGDAAIKHADAEEKLGQKLDDIAHKTTTAARATSDLTDEAVKAINETNLMETAVGGHSKAIDLLVASIKRMLPERDKHTAALKAEAAALQDVLNKTDGLSAAQRKAIQDVIDLANGTDKLADSIKAMTSAVDASTSKLGEQKTAIQAAAEAAQKQLDTNTSLTSVERERYAEMIVLAKQIDALEKQEKKLTDAKKDSEKATKSQNTAEKEKNQLTADSIAQEREQAVAAAGLTAAVQDHTITIGLNAKAIQEEIARKQLLLKMLADESTAVKDSTTSHAALRVEMINGKEVITNVGEETIKATGSLKDGTAVITNVTSETVKMTGSLKDGTAVITNVGAEAQKAASSEDSLKSAVQGAADAAGDAKAKFDQHVEALTKLNSVTPQAVQDSQQLLDVFVQMVSVVDDLNSKLDAMPSKISAAASSAGAAAKPTGGAESYGPPSPTYGPPSPVYGPPAPTGGGA